MEGVELPARGLDLLRRQLEPAAHEGGRPRLDGVGVLDARPAVRPVHGQPGGRVDGRVDGADLVLIRVEKFERKFGEKKFFLVKFPPGRQRRSRQRGLGCPEK